MTCCVASLLNQRSGPDCGFTLLEMLVALVLLALAAALLPGTLQLGVRGMTAGTTLDAREGGAAARHFLATRLSEAQPKFHTRAAGSVRLDFEGTAEAVSFVAPAAASDRVHGLVRYRLGVHDGALAVSIFDAEAEKDAQAARTQHLAGVDALSFRYFGRKAKDERAAWHQDWRGERVLPRLVEFTLADAAASPVTRVWLRLAPAD